MSAAGVRAVAFGGLVTHVEANGEAALRVLDFLYPAADVAPLARAASDLTIASDTAGVFDVARGGILLYRGRETGEAARVLQGAVTEWLAAGCASGLAFHAGAVCRRGRALLLPGGTGAGKTTLVAHLVSQGADYLTDELSFVPAGTSTVCGLPRPLNVKASGRPFVPAAAALWDTMGSPVGALLRPPSGRVNGATEMPTLAGVVFPQFEPSASAEMEPMTAAECGLRLLESLLNARNLPEHGFGGVTHLARLVPAWRLRYGTADIAAARVLQDGPLI